MSPHHTGLVAELLKARDAAQLVVTPPETRSQLDLDTGYQIGRVLHEHLAAKGFRSVGRKIGLTNRAMWEQFRATQPIWAHIYSQTVQFADAGRVRVSLDGMTAPRLEPEIVLKLRGPVPTNDPTPETLAACIEWAAVGFEIVDSHFPEWRMTAAEAVADFGVHAALVVGEPWVPKSQSPEEVARTLEGLRVTLSQENKIYAEGQGRNALGSPLRALGSLAQVVAAQPWAPPLSTGEIITTGTLTPLPYIRRGERWQVTVSGAPLLPLELRIEN